MPTISVSPGALYQTHPLSLACSWALHSNLCPLESLRTSILSILCSLSLSLARRCMSSNFIAYVSLPYIILHWTYVLYTLPFTFRDTPLSRLEVGKWWQFSELNTGTPYSSYRWLLSPTSGPYHVPLLTQLVNVFQFANMFNPHLTPLFSSLYSLNATSKPKV